MVIGCVPSFSIELSNAFGLLVQWPEDPQEKLLVFRMEAESTSSKTDTIQRLARLMAEAQFSTNSVRTACTATTKIILHITYAYCTCTAFVELYICTQCTCFVDTCLLSTLLLPFCILPSLSLCSSFPPSLPPSLLPPFLCSPHSGAICGVLFSRNYSLTQQIISQFH